MVMELWGKEVVGGEGCLGGGGKVCGVGMKRMGVGGRVEGEKMRLKDVRREEGV